MIKKISILILVFLCIILVSCNVQAKYVIERVYVVAKLEIDRTPPSVEITYSTKDVTSENIKVTIKADEEIQEIEGWEISEDKKEISRIYDQNVVNNIVIKDLVGNEVNKEIKITNIDKEIPYFELISVTNTNNGYEGYANKTHTITAKIKVVEKNIVKNDFNTDNIEINVQNQEINPGKFEINEIQKVEDGIIYDIVLGGIEQDGNISIYLKEGIIQDIGQKSEENKIDLKIKIDNIAPSGKFTEISQQTGKSIGEILANEKIREVEGWQISNDKLKLSKEFTNNISYIFQITDYAQNVSNVEINISKATYINLVYASHNSRVGWTFGYGNYDIAGAEAVELDPKFKTEALAFKVSGNIDNDFIMARAYVYTYWGSDKRGVCGDTGIIYDYGYNPGPDSWNSMAFPYLTTINDEKYFQFGGSLMNANDRTALDGTMPIPLSVSEECRYGISAITMALKDYSYYSIIYQIYVNESGWLNPASDGEETKVDYTKPMSAFRMTLVPKTEKQYVIDLWNKDVGTSNMK